ncbi:MAG: hypothetical protein EOO87_14460 [Pedobacter sp.]|nr:MAG: hypothetical protein EOO87_14460 [Pedobacter sp.]
MKAKIMLITILTMLSFGTKINAQNKPEKETLQRLKTSLLLLADQDLAKDYPLVVLDKETTLEYFLVHLFGHLNYHLGQINYHRRIVESK